MLVCPACRTQDRIVLPRVFGSAGGSFCARCFAAWVVARTTRMQLKALYCHEQRNG